MLTFTELVDLRSQTGTGCDHRAVDKHVMRDDPCNRNPSSQVKVMEAPDARDVPLRVPFNGVPGSAQVITAKTKKDVYVAVFIE